MLVWAFGMEMALIASSAAAIPPQAMPAPLWRGVSRIALACSSDFNVALCTTIAEAARVRTPLPVAIIIGKAPINRDTVILTLAPDDSGRQLVAVARRALEIDDAESPARYVVPWNAAAPIAAVEDLLTRILPHRPGGARRSE